MLLPTLVALAPPQQVPNADLGAGEPGCAERLLGLAAGSFPFASHFLSTRGARLHYVDEGHGPVLFMLHGNPTWSYLYRHLVAALRSRFRCIAMDLPGFGLSLAPPGFAYSPEASWPLVLDLLHHLDIQNGTLVAHNWGGPIGLAAAMEAPWRLNRFVLGNTWAWPLNGDWQFEIMSRLMGGPLGRWGAQYLNAFVNVFFVNSMFQGAPSPATLRAYRAPLLFQGHNTAHHVYAASLRQSQTFLRRVQSGVRCFEDHNYLFLWPQRDPMFRSVELAHWLGLLPQAQVLPLPDCGHFPWEERPSQTAQAIAQWVSHPQHLSQPAAL